MPSACAAAVPIAPRWLLRTQTALAFRRIGLPPGLSLRRWTP